MDRRMYLLDTNIWLERLLEQTRSAEVEQFLNQISSEKIFITDFTLHSIALILMRRELFDVFTIFVQDLFIDSAVNLLSLPPQKLIDIPAIMQQEKLDYDDAYQYYSAQRHQLLLISFDTDFDRTTMGRKTPIEILAAL